MSQIQWEELGSRCVVETVLRDIWVGFRNQDLGHGELITKWEACSSPPYSELLSMGYFYTDKTFQGRIGNY